MANRTKHEQRLLADDAVRGDFRRSHVLKKAIAVLQSMSRRGNCWDNAVAESFFKSLKCELIYGNKLLSAEQVDLEIFEYIEIFYNKIRRHSALKNRTIEEFNKPNKISA